MLALTKLHEVLQYLKSANFSLEKMFFAHKTEFLYFLNELLNRLN